MEAATELLVGLHGRTADEFLDREELARAMLALDVVRERLVQAPGEPFSAAERVPILRVVRALLCVAPSLARRELRELLELLRAR
jgi:hypothetical protein